MRNGQEEPGVANSDEGFTALRFMTKTPNYDARRNPGTSLMVLLSWCFSHGASLPGLGPILHLAKSVSFE